MAQLGALGVPPSAVQARIERGSLHRVHRGVYSVGHTVISRDGSLLAAVLACGPGAVLCRRSAAEAWGLMRPRDADPEVARASVCRRPRIVVHRALGAGDERRVLDGIPVTSPPRTLVDLAAALDADGLERPSTSSKSAASATASRSATSSPATAATAAPSP